MDLRQNYFNPELYELFNKKKPNKNSSIDCQQCLKVGLVAWGCASGFQQLRPFNCIIRKLKSSSIQFWKTQMNRIDEKIKYESRCWEIALEWLMQHAWPETSNDCLRYECGQNVFCYLRSCSDCDGEKTWQTWPHPLSKHRRMVCLEIDNQNLGTKSNREASSLAFWTKPCA